MELQIVSDFLRNVVVITVAVFVTALIQESNSVNNTLEVPANASCACPEETLTYTCNIVGGGNTLWGGTAFNCPSTSNEIILRHSQFSEGDSGTCSNGVLMGRTIGVMNTNCYTSQLQVDVSTSLNYTTVRCTHDSINSGQILIGNVSTIKIANGLDPPDSFKLINIRGGLAILEWSPVISTCPLTITYTISSNCSSYTSEVSNSTTASYPIPRPNVSTGDTICSFSIQSVVCEGIGGEQSDSLIVIIPAQPSSVEIIVHYSNDDNSLTKLRILGKDVLIATSGETNLFITTYNVTYSDPANGNIVDSIIVNVQEASETEIAPPTSLCPFTITISADNGFDQGQLSDPVTIECTNQFVKVQYNSATSTITCTFLNQSDTSLKSCSIRYGSCDQQQRKTVQGNSSSSKITLSLEYQNSFCYTAIARNGTFAVAVQGSIIEVVGGAVSAGVVAAIIVVVVLLILLIISILIICLVYFSRRRRITGGMIFSQLRIKGRLNLQEISQDRFKLYTIESSCRLRDAAAVKDAGDFKRGYAYYEFIHEKENIAEGKEIILMREGRRVRHFFTPGPDVTADTLRDYRLLGDGVKKPNLDNYVVFVQSTGSGARHLPAGSRLLYNQQEKEEWQPSKILRVKVNSNHFQKSEIEKECTLKTFLKNLNFEPKKYNVFLNVCDVDRKKIGDIRDAILMKDNGDLFTGPGVRSLIDDPSAMQNIFVTAKFKNKTKLKEGSIVLHQDPKYVEERFHVLRVDENNVQMSAFIERKLNLKFENGRAFHEFAETEEDLLCYSDVVGMKKDISEKYKRQQGDNGEEIISLEMGIMYFYCISNAPGAGIKPPMFEKFEVFVQSTSQGSRCLKENTLVLYKVNH